MTFSSPSIAPGSWIDSRHTCDGDDLSPELRWSGLPDGTRSMALIVDDPDAPSGTFTHWVLFDIPASVDRLAEGAPEFGVAGRNDFRRVGYGGPCPPRDHGPHRYFFRLYALDVESLELPEGASQREVESAMEPHILEQAELMGRYARR
jgi:Raf kinase inhibitor-like YbhB/YbcL family protein